MRPVCKKEPEEILDGKGIKEDYKDHSEARSMLTCNLGRYCSYCEVFIRDPQLEHIQPKSIHSALEYKWSNFLLACGLCNSKKSDKDVVLKEVHLPHLNNTYLSLCYKEAGVVIVNPTLDKISQQHAENLLKLVGFDGFDKQDSCSQYRREIWDIAEICLRRYEAGEYQLDLLMEYIKAVGYWSVWFTVFKTHDEVRKALIEEFPGTAKECFDADNHYEPINRNPNNESDPV